VNRAGQSVAAVTRTVAATREALATLPRPLGLVPTMGALHDGHLALLAAAARECASVVVSIFVNPTQFGPSEDFAKYPRTWDSDLETAAREGAEAVFAPGTDFYPEGYRTIVRVPEWNSVLEGEIRPVHFDGVTSVVAKLFHAVEPDVAVFGQKDAQQALLIRRMVRDLDFGLRLVVAPIVRERDGLALSSRNRYLSPTDRQRALVLSRALRASSSAWKSGCRNPSGILSAGRVELEAAQLASAKEQPADAKVILAGSRDPAGVLAAIREHAYAYFHKPISAGPLADMVQLALDATTWRDDIRVASARPEWITLEVRCKLEAAERTTQFIREMLADLEPQTAEDIAAAFRELLINAIEHGGKSDAHKRVRASLLRTSHAVMTHIADPGKGFSLETLPHAAISNPDGSPTKHIEYREEHGKRAGGFGILMSRHLVDELLYNQRGNAVLAMKYLK